MKNAITLLHAIASILVIFALHTGVAYSAPYPIYNLHTIYIYLVWLLIHSQKTKAMWLALTLGYLTELFSAETFGVHTITLLISVTVVGWLIEKIFTSHSWYIILIIGLCATLTYRLLFILVSSASHFFKDITSYLTSNTIESAGVEILVNTTGLLLLYGINKLFTKRVNPRYI